MLGHHIPAELEFADEAVSGTRPDRAGLAALLAAARAGRFRVVYFDSLSRLAREVNASLATLTELVEVLGVRVISVSEGLDSTAPGWQLQAIFRSWGHQEYVATLRAAVIRGQEDGVLNDRSVGDWPYGYRSEPIPGSGDTRRSCLPRKRIVVDEAQAEWVRQVFRWFADDGWSIRAIATELTRRRVPRCRRATNAGWHHVNVRKMLANRKYIGVWIWGATRVRQNPLSGRKWLEPRPAQVPGRLERVRPDLRIVPDELFHRAAERLARNRAGLSTRRRPDGTLTGPAADPNHPRHLLQQLIVCGECGRTFHVVGLEHRLRCSGVGLGECNCRTQVQRDQAARVLLDRVGQLITADPAWQTRVLAAAEEAWDRTHRERPGERAALEAARAAAARRVERLLDSIEAQGDDPQIRGRLDARQREVADLDHRLAMLPDEAEPVERPTAQWVAARLRELHAVLTGGDATAAIALRRLIGPIVVTEETHPGWRRKFLRGRFRPRVGAVLPAGALGDVQGGEEVVIDLGLTPERVSRAARVAELTAAGWTTAAIAAELGCSAYTVIRARRVIREHGGLSTYRQPVGG